MAEGPDVRVSVRAEANLEYLLHHKGVTASFITVAFTYHLRAIICEEASLLNAFSKTFQERRGDSITFIANRYLAVMLTRRLGGK